MNIAVRFSLVVSLVGCLVGPVRAGGIDPTCPGSCVTGGGPAATDCFIQFGGITSNAVTCTDGDPGCDLDGLIDGVCTLALSACVNVPSAGCTSTGLSAAPTVKPTKEPAAQALAAALAQLSLTEQACTAPPYAASIKVAVAGLKPGVSKLAFTAASGGKKDKDKLVITCNPSTIAPSLTNVVQPIFDGKCATPGCHTSDSGSGSLNMKAGHTYDECVSQASVSTLAKGLKIVEPGSVKKSYLARKVMGKGLAKFDSPMPQGCPGFTPCLTAPEMAQVLTWIQAGAPNN